MADQAYRVESDRLGLQTINKRPVRVVYDGWRQRDRIFRYTGACIVCGRKTWSFDDGENDPRGMLGDHALWTTEAETRTGELIELRTCAICANDYDRYQQALELAKQGGNNLTPLRHVIPADFGVASTSERHEPTYRIVRFYQDDRPREVIEDDLTLEQAKAHCLRPDTRGEGWFDGFEEVTE
jgi:hypothetical protein